MANTFHQMFVHVVFSVRNKEYVLPSHHKEELHKYISGIVTNNNCKTLAINSMPDHMHIFIGLNPSVALSELVKDIKLASGDFIKENKWIRGKFYWQKGFGVFSYSKSQIDMVCKYIKNQEEHHKRVTFKEEYIDFLKKFDVPYNEKYVFDME